jgi:DNA-binding response OmpR family regulator
MEKIRDILVVDDDSLTVEFLIEALHEEGYSGCAAYDGESALLAIETARPELVLLDLHLAGLSGVDVVSQLRRHGLAHVPIVLMTADVAAAAQLPTSTFRECLLKPFDIDTLLACIRRYVRPQRHARALTTHPAASTGDATR